MAPKRQLQQEKDDGDRQKRRTGDSQQPDRHILGYPWLKLPVSEIVPHVEGLVRRLTKEQLDRILSSRSIVNHTETSGARSFELRFENKLRPTIFTLSKIKAEDNTPIQIALYDIRSQSKVTVGRLSSIKIKICVLDGEFGSNGIDDWTAKEFKDNIPSQRKGKGSLLNGDTIITLKDGVGLISNKIVFTDNSCWTRCRKFRLGAEVLPPISNEICIREGRSEPFMVKDCRGEANQKHHPPSLNDEICRLEKIARNGIFQGRLSLHGITTVKDLLQLYETDQPSLKEKFGNIPKKQWETIIEHAKTCLIDDCKRYVFYNHAAEQPIGLILNVIYKAVGVTFDGRSYRSPDTLSLDEKPLVERVKQYAYKNLKDLIPVDNETSARSLLRSKLETAQAGQCVAPVYKQQFGVISTSQQEQLEPWPSCSHPSTSIGSLIGEATGNNQIRTVPLQELGALTPNVSFELLAEMLEMERNGSPRIGSQLPVLPGANSSENDYSRVQFTAPPTYKRA